MKYELITKSPKAWVRETDLTEYAQKQAQSCEYLKFLLDIINTQSEELKKELRVLFGYLKKIHKRQYSDLNKAVFVPKSENRRSYYFDRMYSKFKLSPSLEQLAKRKINKDDLLTILSIHAISYLRGNERYFLLKNYHWQDERLRKVWELFFKDADKNSEKVFSFINKNFDSSESDKRIRIILKYEDELIHKIWRYNNVI